MTKAILYCVLLLIGLHVTARGLAQLDLGAHFSLVTLLGTTLILPVSSFYILNKERKDDNVRSIIIKAFILFSIVYASFLLDNDFNEHTDEVGRELGKLSLITGFVVVCVIMVIRALLNVFLKKSKLNN